MDIAPSKMEHPSSQSIMVDCEVRCVDCGYSALSDGNADGFS